MIYLITRTDHVGYDEFDAVVVRVASEDEARQIVIANGQGFMDEDWATLGGSFRNTRFTVEEVPADGRTCVILGSFNAG